MGIKLQNNRWLSDLLNTGMPQRFVVGYSGGVDSHVLLHAMNSLLKGTVHQLSAIYVNHGLSEHAMAWQQHCEQVCGELNVPFQTIALDLKVKSRQSLEAEARKARYQALRERSTDGCVILLGQHQDDQFETFLLQLKRGAGPKGLSSMPAYTRKLQREFLRPLLEYSREEILEYAHSHGLQWVEDESNHDTGFERNFLRAEVIPALKCQWPQIAASVSRSALLCAEQQAMLDEVTQSKLTCCIVDEGVLSLITLREYSSVWQKQIIRLWLSEQEITLPSSGLMTELLEQFVESRSDSSPEITMASWIFRRFQQHLYVMPWRDQPSPTNQRWHQGDKIPLSTGQWLELCKAQNTDTQYLVIDTDQDEVDIVFGGFSTRFKPQGETHTRPLKQWFKIWGIPPWERNVLPLIYINGQLSAVGNIAVSATIMDRVLAQGRKSISEFRVQISSEPN